MTLRVICCFFALAMVNALKLVKLAGENCHWDGIARIRELEIARLAAGATNEEIGMRLLISPNTVKKALKSIYAKLAVNNRVRLRQRLDEFDWQHPVKEYPRG